MKFATDGLAHDLRSPLTRLRSTLERALVAEDDEEARKAVARALEEGDRLLAMLETALQISRAEAGLGRAGFAETDIAALLRDLAEVYGGRVSAYYPSFPEGELVRLTTRGRRYADTVALSLLASLTG
ncbi:MAG: hypothetical protein ABS70_06585 [Nitrospira sp. SCN 59-13]|nr:MAG: hypothetical protein ABS70_06585 [Nitrospira sp. SCN 59-13]